MTKSVKIWDPETKKPYSVMKLEGKPNIVIPDSDSETKRKKPRLMLSLMMKLKIIAIKKAQSKGKTVENAIVIDDDTKKIKFDVPVLKGFTSPSTSGVPSKPQTKIELVVPNIGKIEGSLISKMRCISDETPLTFFSKSENKHRLLVPKIFGNSFVMVLASPLPGATSMGPPPPRLKKKNETVS